MGKELAKKETTAIVTAAEFENDACLGTEGADADSCAIPFLMLLQGLSPQIESVEGAKPGKFLNSITEEVYDTPVVIPCAFRRRYIAWAPRDEGGGYRGAYSPAEVEHQLVEGLGKTDEGFYKVNGNELQDTREHFVLVQSADGFWQPSLLTLKSTQVKKSKRWISRMKALELKNKDGKAYNPPSFSHMYRLETKKEENNKGSWYGLEARLVEPVNSPELYAKAKKFYQEVVKGKIDEQVQEPTKEETF